MEIDKKRYLKLSTTERARRIRGRTSLFVEALRAYAVAEPPYSIRTIADTVRADNELARMKKSIADEMNSFCEEIEELRRLTLRDKLTNAHLFQVVYDATWKSVFEGPTPNTFFSGNYILTIDDEHVSIGKSGDPTFEFTLTKEELQELRKALTREPRTKEI